MYQIALLITLSIGIFTAFINIFMQWHHYPWFVAIILALVGTSLLDFVIVGVMTFYSFWSIHKKLIKHHEEYK
jgi:hypothetical protein